MDSPATIPAATAKPLLRVLIVEDSEIDARVLVAHLRQGGWQVQFQRVSSVDGFVDALRTQAPDLILCDHVMPGFSAPEALQLLQKTGIDVPFLIVSGEIEEGVAIAAMKAGAHDFLIKGYLGRLVPAVQRELREAATRAAKRAAENALRQSELRYRSVWENSTDAVFLIDLDGIIRFASPAVHRVFGRTADSLIGSPFDLLRVSEAASESWWHLARASQGSKTFHTETLRPDGVRIDLDLAFTEMRMEDQLWVVAFIRDITERLRQEEELRRSRQEFAVARDIQQQLFPKSAPSLEGFDIAGVSVPAEAAGGDYYDFLKFQDGALGLVVADVCGHGIGPALLMAETRTCLRLLARSETSAGTLLSNAERNLAGDIDAIRYITLCAVCIDPHAKTLTHASAGHPAAWVVALDGSTKAVLKRTGFPLGRQHGKPYETSSPIQLESGDCVLLMTDGVDETVDSAGEFFGTDRALQIINDHRHEPAEQIVRRICNAARSFAKPAPQNDDLTVVLAKVL
ncbi:MAG TPA: SpoIIE family protein phosphatase [Candidatus Limnocylindria bacterium]|jgi:sigma-B regulation protein RsbU (phosphoserine phosphatase)|nr:SpoIIE family protein phosphatase [Candidatus Limnocylindria bacterium]